MPETKASGASLVVRAPKHLGVFQDRAPATIRFLASLRSLCQLAGKRAVLVDFSNCQTISRAACLLITAELKRARNACHGDLAFVAPNKADLADLFDSFGVYAYFRIPSPLSPAQRRVRRKNTLVVRSGDAGSAPAAKLDEIAEVALRMFNDESQARDVTEALEEAMFNSSEHAYVGVDLDLVPADRWWFAGLYDPDAGEAFFYALDHGVGIPARAQVRMGQDIQAYWESDPMYEMAAKGDACDRDRLVAAIRAPRLHTPGGRGKGLPTMVNFLDDAEDGEVRIYSGAAVWHSRRRKNARQGASNSFERCYQLRREFPGTLVYWRVAGTLKPQAKVRK